MLLPGERGRRAALCLLALLECCALLPSFAFDSDWTRLWTTAHDGDEAIEKELLTRLESLRVAREASEPPGLPGSRPEGLRTPGGGRCR